MAPAPSLETAARRYARGEITDAQLRAQLHACALPLDVIWEQIENERARAPRFAHALARAAFEIARRKRSASARARAQLALIQTLNTLGEFSNALALCADTAARFAKLADRDNRARVWLEASSAELWRGNLDSAATHLERAQETAPDWAAQDALGFSVHWIQTRVLSTQGAWNHARAYAEKWLTPPPHARDARAVQQRIELARVQLFLNPAQVVQLLETVLNFARRRSYRTERAWCEYYLAQAHMDLGAFQMAHRRLLAAQLFAERERMRFLHALCDLDLGVLALYKNDFEAALQYQTRAREVFLELGTVQEASSCEVNLGEILNQLNRFAEAIPYLEHALAIARATGRKTKAGVCYENLSRSYGGLGDTARAISHAMQARQIYAAEKMDLRLAEGDLRLGELYQQIGQFARASRCFRRARRAAQRGQSPSLIAQADLHLAQLALQRGARAAAEQPLARADAQFHALRQMVYVALCERLRAQTANQPPAAALRLLQTSRRRFAQHHIIVEMALCDLTRGDLYRAWGEWNAAARAYQRARQLLDPAFPDHAWRAAYGAAKIAQARGDLARAAVEIRRASTMIASQRAGLVIETWSNDLFYARRHVFAEAVQLAARQAHAAETLELIETAKAQLFLQQLALREWSADATSAGEWNVLLTRERALRQQYLLKRKQFMLNAAPDALSSPHMRGVPSVAALARLAQNYEALAERVRLARRGLKGNPSLAPFALETFRAYAAARWGDAWTALDYFFAKDILYIVCVDAHNVRVRTTRWTQTDRADLAQATANHPDLRELVYNGTLRGAIVPARRDVLTMLAARLLPDDLPQATGAHTLIISPHAQLHQLPFHALPWRGAPLLEQFTCLNTPNLQSLVELARGKAKRTNGSLFVCGAEHFADAPPLAHARRETDTLARMSKHTTKLWQTQATRENILDLNQRGILARCDILHFATHALADARAPHASRVLLGDGELSALDIADLNLDARLVTLSACSSALGKGGSGDEALGLARAFFYAGARAVVASLWNVDDASTADLMKLFYQKLKGGHAIGEALREAQLEMKRKGYTVFHWAPFVAIGAD